jgi:hypothetical protein
MNKIDTRSLALVLAIMGTAVLGVTAMQANAQAKPPAEKVLLTTKTELKRGLTVDLDSLEATARSAHEALQAVLAQVKASEAAMAGAEAGSPEADAASEAWIKAQGAGIVAQENFNLAMRELEMARNVKATAATAFVDERCAADNGKDADIKRLCDKLAAVKAEQAAKEAEVAARVAEANKPVGP